MATSAKFLVQVAHAVTEDVKEIVKSAGAKVVEGADDLVALVDDVAYAKLKEAKGLQVERVQWLGSMADPGGRPTDQSLYPRHMPLTDRQVAKLHEDGARLYRVSGMSEETLKAVASKLQPGASLELAKRAGPLHGDQRELTVKANDQGILGLLAANGAQVSVC
ncbi:hypothetical protein PMI42_03111 [Bradyrhizobium sp. YR681]|uniref:hypothetical protein n=1 Tax=Bradyrhizobium sp. YR681 TaxID=1144344 RepID=UPI0002711BBC|nr:hypothetical protein [Bradyrhizobium sp. YR681]EJN13538.1 hypothetical protein PMI42_03111 [Bradyrhizobium sp. YR681]